MWKSGQISKNIPHLSQYCYMAKGRCLKSIQKQVSVYSKGLRYGKSIILEGFATIQYMSVFLYLLLLRFAS